MNVKIYAINGPSNCALIGPVGIIYTPAIKRFVKILMDAEHKKMQLKTYIGVLVDLDTCEFLISGC